MKKHRFKSAISALLARAFCAMVGPYGTIYENGRLIEHLDDN